MATPKPKPVLLFMAHPLTGHITPTLRIASHFSSQNYKVYFLGPTSHKQRIASAGCIFLPLLGSADIDDLAYYTPESPESTGNPSSSSDEGGTWQSRALVDFQQIWINPLPDSWRSVTSALSEIFSSGSSSSPELTELTIVSEAMFFGILPLFLNAPLPPPLTFSSLSSIKTVCLSIMVPFIRSPEIGPGFSDSLPFLPSRAAQVLRAEEQWSVWTQRTSHLSDLLDSQLLSVGCSTGLSGFGPFLSGANYALLGGRARSDSSPAAAAILQLGCPSFFYPRSSWPATFRFIGILPPAAEPKPGGWPNLPTWWDEVVKNHHDDDKNKNKKRKKIVVVAQGTVETDPNDLIIPTITAMASPPYSNEDDAAVIVIAILGRKNASLPPDFPLPPNARVTDYLHYDAVLPFADAWVHNAGYGAVQHGIANGVPMVVTGEGQDKADNAKRIAWSGIGINLGRVKPPAEQVKKALEAVLFEDGYRDRVRRMLEESRGLDCFKLAEEAVLKAAG